MSRGHGYRAGLAAEAVAALMLRARGWRIVARRMKTPLGEIDIIAHRGGVTAFIEVKKRRRHEDALAALRPQQQRRLVKAARWWLAGHPQALNGACRFDLVAVNDWMWPVHLVNVLDAGELGEW